MQLHNMRTVMLPVAMIGGAIFYPWMGYLTFLSPYLIFLMLFITYCKLDFRHIRLERFHFYMLAVQMALAAACYFLLFKFNHTVAEGIFICFFIPTATAAPVITSMLGGSIAKVATYSLFGNIFTAIAGPLVLAAIGDNEISFLHSFWMILCKVMPLLILPIAAALFAKKFMPRFHKTLMKHQEISFYMWALALFIIVGSCVSFTINNFEIEKSGSIIMLAAGALAACMIQFKCGWYVGKKFGDKVSGGQGMAQKNTVLAVWLALAYMDPIASIAPAAYIAWQNIINSWQLIRHDQRKSESLMEKPKPESKE